MSFEGQPNSIENGKIENPNGLSVIEKAEQSKEVFDKILGMEEFGGTQQEKDEFRDLVNEEIEKAIQEGSEENSFANIIARLNFLSSNPEKIDEIILSGDEDEGKYDINDETARKEAVIEILFGEKKIESSFEGETNSKENGKNIV